nr:chemosensory protein [Chilo suppressalis]
MKSMTVFCMLAFVAVAYALPQQYTDKYDSVDLTEILSNRRLLVPYLNCILTTGKCSPDGKELRSHIKEALENYCAKCTETQKNGTRRVIGHLINNEADYWKKLVDKYDPERKYVVKYEEELKTVAA